MDRRVKVSPHNNWRRILFNKEKIESSMMSPKSSMCDSTNKPEISVKKSSTNVGAGRHGVPNCVEVHELITMEMDEVFTLTKRRHISLMMSPTYSM